MTSMRHEEFHIVDWVYLVGVVLELLDVNYINSETFLVKPRTNKILQTSKKLQNNWPFTKKSC